MRKMCLQSVLAISQQRAPKLNARCIMTTTSYISNGNRYRNSGALFFGFPQPATDRFFAVHAFFRYQIKSRARRALRARLKRPLHTIHVPANAQGAVFCGGRERAGDRGRRRRNPLPPLAPNIFFFRTGGTCSCGCTGTLINRFGESIVSVNYY